jgi:hypothetical protein
MSRTPRIPMLPTQLPQQRLHLVKGVPQRPEGWTATLGEPRDAAVPAAMPRSSRLVGQVEWAWSPMHSRLDAYYLSMDRSRARWLLWSRYYDDNWSRWQAGSVVACGPRGGLDAKAAAQLLLAAFWTAECRDGTDRFHWVNEDGLLSAGEMSELAVVAWPEGEGDSAG